MTPRQLISISGLAMAMLLPSPALADAIDGEWCSADGRHISIDGPTIVTPGGTRMSGDYRRHFFSYTVPKTERPAGSAVAMTLIDDDTLHLKTGSGPENPTETWRRCTQPTS